MLEGKYDIGEEIFICSEYAAVEASHGACAWTVTSTYPKISVGQKRRSALYSLPNGNPLEDLRHRVHKGMVLVHLCLEDNCPYGGYQFIHIPNQNSISASSQSSSRTRGSILKTMMCFRPITSAESNSPSQNSISASCQSSSRTTRESILKTTMCFRPVISAGSNSL